MGAVIGAAIKALIASLAAMFGSWKAFMAGLLVVTFGIVMYNLVVDITEEVLTYAVSSIASMDEDIPSGVLSVTGLGAWMCHTLGMEAMISMAVMFVGLKWLVIKVRFLKW